MTTTEFCKNCMHSKYYPNTNNYRCFCRARLNQVGASPAKGRLTYSDATCVNWDTHPLDDGKVETGGVKPETVNGS